MPGLVMMERHGANGSVAPITGKRTADQAFGDLSTKKMEPNTLTNGDVGSPRLNGPDVNGTTSAEVVQPPQPIIHEPAPEIPKRPDVYKPLGELISRVTQACFNELSKTLDKTSQIQRASQPAHALVNGISSHAGVNGVGVNPRTNQEKKKELLDFANTYREKFIKLMVLTDWSQKVEDVHKMLDLGWWTEHQFCHYDNAKFMLADIHAGLQAFKLRNPDIKTALEVLSTGKAPWMPEFDYLPEAPLTAKKIQQAIRDIEMQLTIRLNLHEDLPFYLRDYRIHDGRATFSFPSEFELDVTIGSEDSSKQLCFIDVRFLFHPAPRLSDSITRGFIQEKCTELLGTGGIAACCDFLRNFTFTHKIGILRKQAVELARHNWSGTLRVDQIHRSLIVQYWKESTRGKSWIEIGISSGKRKDGRPSLDGREANIFIHARWARDGAKPAPLDLPLDLDNLDMEALLKRVTAAHIQHILASARETLLSSASDSKALSVELKTSDAEPLDCYLRLRLSQHLPWTELSMDPITGHFFIRPSSPVAVHAQFDLNGLRNPVTELHTKIELFLAIDMLRNIEREAERRGWKPARNIKLTQDQLKKAFRTNPLRYSFFYLPGWTASNWVVAATINLSGCTWRILQLADKVTGDYIHTHRILVQPETSSRHQLDQLFLKKFEQNAARTVAFLTAGTQLKANGIHFKFLECPPRRTEASADEINSSTAMPRSNRNGGPRLSILETDLTNESASSSDANASYLHISYQRFDTRSGQVHFAVRVLSKQAQQLPTTYSDSNAVASAEHGCGFVLYLQVPIGTSCIDQLRSRLRSLIRQQRCLQVLQAARLKPHRVSLKQLAFVYARNPTLSIDLNFPESTERPITVVIAPSNPHRRIKALLQRHLNWPSPSSFAHFIRGLLLTLPLMRAFNTIEQRALARGDMLSLAVHPRNIDFFKLCYANPACAWEIRLRQVRDDIQWQISEAPSANFPILPRDESRNGREQQGLPQPQNQKRDEKFVEAVRKHFWGAGAGWCGLMTMINTTTWSGVEEALSALDELLTMFRVENGSGGAVAAAAATATGVQSEQGQSKGKSDGQSQDRGQTHGSKKSAAKSGREVVVLID